MDEIKNELVLKILGILRESNIEEVKLEMVGIKLHFKRNAKDIFSSQEDSKHQAVSKIRADQLSFSQAPWALEQNKEERQNNKLEPGQGLLKIKAPMLGKVYLSPGPTDAPFIKVGDFAREDDIICWIEVMDSVSPVKSGIKCQIAQICVEDGQMVEFNQTLFLGKAV